MWLVPNVLVAVLAGHQALMMDGSASALTEAPI